MKRKMNLAIALSLALAVGCAGMAMAAAPVLQWSLTTPLSGSASVYYGSVVNNTYYTGQHQSGALAYSTTGLLQSLQGDGRIAKSVVKIGSTFYGSMDTGGVRQLDSAWTTLTAMSIDQGIPDALASDGSYLYGNDYTTGKKNVVSKYSVSGTTMSTVWTSAVAGVTRFRGISDYAGGLIYAVDQGVAGAGGGVYEIDTNTGSATKIISNLNWTGTGSTSGYQAVRSGSNIYAIAGNNLYQYGLSGGTWSLTETNNLPVGGYLYGIGVNSTGTGLWISSGNQMISYYTVAVPEPSSVLALASGFIGLVGAAVRRRRA